MKNKLILFLTVFILAGLSSAAQELQPFYEIGKFDKTIPELAKQVEDTLANAGYEIIGSYHPENKDTLFVLCFTSNSLQQLSLEFPDRGALGAVIKAGFIRTQGKTILSIVNPEYMFLAYYGQQMNNHEEALKAQSKKITGLFSKMGELTAFGGIVEQKKLIHYHYKMLMPYYDDPDELAEFNSFEKGLGIIQKNLNAHKGNTKKVYQLIFPKQKIAVFGVALLNPETGESDFLPIIGESHIAAMPYEIILQGKKATSLAGKYRIALYWPELGMGTFMKIIKTPGRIENTLKKLTTE